MTHSISQLIKSVDTRTEGFHSDGFRHEIEAQLSFLKNHEGNRIVTMEDREPKKYTGDLAGWLLSKNIREDYHWAIARVNGYFNPFEYDGVKKGFIIPSLKVLDDMLQKYLSSRD